MYYMILKYYFLSLKRWECYVTSKSILSLITEIVLILCFCNIIEKTIKK